ncbi:unnamed protein product [Orchesella dallaii]|uniref:RNase NYN domain-containing protein n=1 Tax=Orchesella dallaii TaxID=48710 RepID=A0ABP1QZ52_9HEXA
MASEFRFDTMFFTNSHTNAKEEAGFPSDWKECHEWLTRQRDVSSSSYETSKILRKLSETDEQKTKRIQKWVNVATTQLPKLHAAEKDRHHMRRKRNASSQHSEEGHLHSTGSDTSLHNLSFSSNDKTILVSDISDEVNLEQVEQDAELQCVAHEHNPRDQEKMPNQILVTNKGNGRQEQRPFKVSRMNLETGLFETVWKTETATPLIDYTQKDEELVLEEDSKATTCPEPQFSSEVSDTIPDDPKITMKDHEYVPQIMKVNSGASGVAKVNADISNWKRKISSDYTNMSSEEKRIKRLQRFADDSAGLNSTLDEIIVDRNIQYMKPGNNQPVEWLRCAPEEIEDKNIVSSPGEPVAKVLRIKPLDDSGVLATGKLRPIVVDGSNVAAEYAGHGANRFDCKGIEVCVKHFLATGHDDITVVVPEGFMLPTNKRIINQDVLHQLKMEGRLLTCWCRQIATGKWANSYDDRMIVEVACRKEAVIISNDKYRDLCNEESKWRDTIFHRLLPFRFVPGKPDEMLLPKDPNGRYGPSLEEFLQFP